MFQTAPPTTIGGPLCELLTVQTFEKVLVAGSTLRPTSPLSQGTKIKGDMYAEAPNDLPVHAGPAKTSPPGLKVLPMKGVAQGVLVEQVAGRLLSLDEDHAEVGEQRRRARADVVIGAREA